MRIVGKLDIHGPTLFKGILHLPGNLLVGEIRQERKTALGDAHGPAPYIETLAVGA
jgi:hypothetical protein